MFTCTDTYICTQCACVDITGMCSVTHVHTCPLAAMYVQLPTFVSHVMCKAHTVTNTLRHSAHPTRRIQQTPTRLPGTHRAEDDPSGASSGQTAETPEKPQWLLHLVETDWDSRNNSRLEFWGSLPPCRPPSPVLKGLQILEKSQGGEVGRGSHAYTGCYEGRGPFVWNLHPVGRGKSPGGTGQAGAPQTRRKAGLAKFG